MALRAPIELPREVRASKSFYFKRFRLMCPINIRVNGLAAGQAGVFVAPVRPVGGIVHGVLSIGRQCRFARYPKVGTGSLAKVPGTRAIFEKRWRDVWSRD